jgi:hypothetical protein
MTKSLPNALEVPSVSSIRLVKVGAALTHAFDVIVLWISVVKSVRGDEVDEVSVA